MSRSTQCFAAAMLALCVAASLGVAADLESRLVTGPDGAALVERVTTTAGSDVDAPTGSAAVARGAQVVWQRTLTDAIFTTCAILRPSHDMISGSYLNPPKEAALTPLGGVGTPDWVQSGEEFHVSASRDGDVVAGVDYDSGALTVTVHRWAPGSATPLWSDTITGVSRGGYRTIAVSADGSAIAVLVSVQAGGPFARLYLYHPGSSTPIGTYDGPAGFARNLSIGEDGRFIAFIGLSTAYVVDRNAGVVRWSGNMGATNDPIAVSSDGTYLAFGWQSLQMRQWNGVDYAPLWTVPGSGFALRSVTFSSDSGTFAAGWYRNDYHQNRIQLFDPALAAPLWTHLDIPGAGSYQDLPHDLALTAAGEYLAVGSWGDIVNTNPEIQLFDRLSPVPVAGVDLPGSIFDIDVALDAGGDVLIAAAGKHIHANQSGRGGDLFSISYVTPLAVDTPTGRPIGFEVHVASPFSPGGEIDVSVEREMDVELAIFAVSGRRVRGLGINSMTAGRHLIPWDGLDDGGRRVAPGVYVVRGSGRLGAASTRVVLMP